MLEIIAWIMAVTAFTALTVYMAYDGVIKMKTYKKEVLGLK